MSEHQLSESRCDVERNPACSARGTGWDVGPLPTESIAVHRPVEHTRPTCTVVSAQAKPPDDFAVLAQVVTGAVGCRPYPGEEWSAAKSGTFSIGRRIRWITTGIAATVITFRRGTSPILVAEVKRG